MCKYCEFKKIGLAKKPLYMNEHGEVVFIESENNIYKIISVGRDISCVNFEINYCPMCGRNLKENDK